MGIIAEIMNDLQNLDHVEETVCPCANKQRSAIKQKFISVRSRARDHKLDARTQGKCRRSP